MKRTKWLDLLVVQDRVEAMRGIWAVLGWQMRIMTDEKDEAMGNTG